MKPNGTIGEDVDTTTISGGKFLIPICFLRINYTFFGVPLRRRSDSHDRRRDNSEDRIDKKRLLEIARKNAISMLRNGTLPGTQNMAPEAKEKVLAKMRFGGELHWNLYVNVNVLCYVNFIFYSQANPSTSSQNSARSFPMEKQPADIYPTFRTTISITRDLLIIRSCLRIPVQLLWILGYTLTYF